MNKMMGSENTTTEYATTGMDCPQKDNFPHISFPERLQKLLDFPLIRMYIYIYFRTIYYTIFVIVKLLLIYYKLDCCHGVPQCIDEKWDA